MTELKVNSLERKNSLAKLDLPEAYEIALNSFQDAEANYQQSLLVLLFEQQFVSIKKL